MLPELGGRRNGELWFNGHRVLVLQEEKLREVDGGAGPVFVGVLSLQEETLPSPFLSPMVFSRVMWYLRDTQ